MFANVSFLIFNYDRCLEHYLYKSLCAFYPTIDETSIAEILNAATFANPYGVIGPLPWQTLGGQGLDFGKFPNGRQLYDSAKELRIFTEGVGNPNLRDRIVDTLTRANKCVFLGFAFHRQNMELLQLATRGSLTQIIETSFGVSQNDTSVFQGRVRNPFILPGNYHVELHAMTCGSLFIEYSQTMAE